MQGKYSHWYEPLNQVSILSFETKDQIRASLITSSFLKIEEKNMSNVILVFEPCLSFSKAARVVIGDRKKMMAVTTHITKTIEKTIPADREKKQTIEQKQQ